MYSQEALPGVLLTVCTLRLYNEYGRTYLFDLRGNNYVVDAFHIGNVCTATLLHATSLKKRFPVHPVLGLSLPRKPAVPVILLILVQNHSCAPNCWMKNVVINEHTKRKSVLALFTLEPVEENQELHFSYFGSLDEVGTVIIEEASGR